MQGGQPAAQAQAQPQPNAMPNFMQNLLPQLFKPQPAGPSFGSLVMPQPASPPGVRPTGMPNFMNAFSQGNAGIQRQFNTPPIFVPPRPFPSATPSATTPPAPTPGALQQRRVNEEKEATRRSEDRTDRRHGNINRGGSR